jgi:hypothetical protein
MIQKDIDWILDREPDTKVTKMTGQTQKTFKDCFTKQNYNAFPFNFHLSLFISGSSLPLPWRLLYGGSKGSLALLCVSNGLGRNQYNRCLLQVREHCKRKKSP